MANSSGNYPNRKRKWLIMLLLGPLLDMSPGLPGDTGTSTDDDDEQRKYEQLGLINGYLTQSGRSRKSHSSSMDSVKLPLIVFARIVFLVFWLTRGPMRDLISTLIILAGVAILPFTALAYVAIWQPIGSVNGLGNWLLLGLGLACDLATYLFVIFYHPKR
jgi:hypothetical protein